jgi:hypothetical protein
LIFIVYARGKKEKDDGYEGGKESIEISTVVGIGI